MLFIALLLLLTGFAGLWRIIRGPGTADRVLGAQMMGSTGIGTLLVLAQWLQEAVWQDVALVLALLASMLTTAMVQLLRDRTDSNAAGRSQV